MITTHRGRNTDFRENTIKAFDHALELGAEAVECDLRLTLDKKIVVYHDRKIIVRDKKVTISKTPLSYFAKEGLVTIDELFNYVKRKNIPFYLEVKSSSQILTECVIEKITKDNLWEKVHIIGFSSFIKTAVGLQAEFPKLRVLQIIKNPLSSYIKKPRPSYGLMLGWFDGWHGSGWLFKKLMSIKRLRRIHNFYKKNGFKKVIAGVINKESGFRYFKEAGITDIVTDNVPAAFHYFKSQKG